MVDELLLSVFPGIGMLDRGFEGEGWCVVRGPDLLWGRDVRGWSPPGDVFGGVIGGPPCKAFSRLRRVFDLPPADNLIPEFERIVAEAAPRWFLMEMVPEGPLPEVVGYEVSDVVIRDVWVGGDTKRKRRFSFGTPEGLKLDMGPEMKLLHDPEPLPAICASASTWVPVRIGGSKTRKTAAGRVYGDKTKAFFEQAKVAQGLPDDFDLPGMTVRGKIAAIGNGVPIPMACAIARAVRRALMAAAEEEVA